MIVYLDAHVLDGKKKENPKVVRFIIWENI